VTTDKFTALCHVYTLYILSELIAFLSSEMGVINYKFNEIDSIHFLSDMETILCFAYVNSIQHKIIYA
jgi:hypothetical protein